MKRILSLVCSLCIISFAYAQEVELRGTIQFNTTEPLQGVHVWLYDLSDTTKPSITSTGSDGTFRFPNVTKGMYRLEARSVGFSPMSRVIRVSQSDADLGTFVLIESPINQEEVVIRGRVPPTVQKGDTTEFNANAFKTHPDATAEELVTKLPGVTVDRTGTVQSGGETIQRVLVDGKPFFGDDPAIAMRNLPAEVIDRIQVFDQLDEQAQFTGFDNGQYIKTMNILTRRPTVTRKFGKFVAGYGDNSRYNTGGNLNYSNGDSRWSILGYSNNINAQNFSSQDLLGVLSGNSQRSGGNQQRGGASFGNSSSGVLVGQQQGISTAGMAGGNYSDTIASKTFFHANYLYNQTNNQNDQALTRHYLGEVSGTAYDQQSDVDAINKNHRVNMRLDGALGGSNFFTITPQLMFQDNATTRNRHAVTTLASGEQLRQSASTTETGTNGNTLSGHILYKHKFETQGRTFSLDLNLMQNLKETSSDLASSTRYTSTGSTSSVHQQSHGTWKTATISPNLVYTEPLGMNSQLELNYQPTVSNSSAEKQTNKYDSLSNDFSIFIPTQSNISDNRYTAQRAGASYRYSSQGVNMTFGVGYQRSDLWNEQTFPVAATVSRTFASILPSATFNMKMSKRENLRFYYQTATRAPSIAQLQNVVDVSNPLLLSSGNPNLKQAYTHTLMSRYSLTNPEEGKSMFLLLAGSYTQDYVGNASVTATSDTVIQGVAVAPGVQMTFPQNFDGNWSVRTFMTFGFPVDFISSTMNLNCGVNYSRAPGGINHQINVADACTYSLGGVVGSILSEEFDFTLTYTGNYTTNRNSLRTTFDSDYYIHTAGMRVNWTFWEGVVFQHEMLNVYNTGQERGYKQNALLWNMSLAMKVLSNRAGEFKLGVYDLLGQNSSINQNITSSYIEDSRNQVLTRYYLATFTYTLR